MVLPAFAALLLAAVRPTLDSDMWWHLKTGELILARGWPAADPFSFTAGQNVWIIHEWLSDTLMWLIYRAAGLIGIAIFFALVVALAFGIVYRRCRPRPWPALPVVLLAAAATWSMWGARPQLINWLLTAVFVFVLEGVRGSDLPPRRLWWLVPATALWANLHSAFLVGPTLVGVYTLGGGIERRIGAGAWPVRRSAAVLLGSLAASLANPATYRQTLFPFYTLGSNPIQANILEWRSPDFHDPVAWLFGALLLVIILGWTVGKRPPEMGRWPAITTLLIVGGSAAAGLVSARHIPIFAIVSAPGATAAAAALWALVDERQLHGRRAALLLGVAMLAALPFLGLRAARLLGENEAAVASHFPAAAVDYLYENDLAAARGFNHYNWGGYLIWRGVPVAVDGRTELYGDDIFTRYLGVARAQPGWDRTLDAWNVEYVLIPPVAPLATLLAADPAWERHYGDDTAVVYRRAGR